MSMLEKKEIEIGSERERERKRKRKKDSIPIGFWNTKSFCEVGFSLSPSAIPFLNLSSLFFLFSSFFFHSFFHSSSASDLGLFVWTSFCSLSLRIVLETNRSSVLRKKKLKQSSVPFSNSKSVNSFGVGESERKRKNGEASESFDLENSWKFESEKKENLKI